MKKTLTFVLAALMVLSTVLVACSGNGGDNTDTTTAAVTDSGKMEAELSVLPKMNYDGYEFEMTYRDLYNNMFINDMLVDEEADDALSVAKYNRQIAVEEYLGVKICPTMISGDWCGDKSVDLVYSGDAADVIMPHSHIAWNQYIGNNLALEWTENLKYTYLDQAWWDQGAKENLSVGNKIFTMLGDSSWELLGFTVGIVFNLDVFDDNEIEYPYNAVTDGSWTFEKFHLTAKQAMGDLNGDGVIDLDNDRMGYTTGIYMGTMGFLWSTGETVIKKNSDDMPEFNAYNAKINDLYDDFFGMMTEEGFYIYNTRDSMNQDFHKEFSAGKVAMIDTLLMNIDQLREQRAYGIVPYPKYDETVEGYHSTADAGIHSIIIPYYVTGDAADRTSIILEALSIEGYRQVIPAFYEVTLQKKYTVDDISVKMLDIIRNTRTFDFGYYTSSTGPFAILGANMYNHNGSYSSFYDKNIESAMTGMNDFIASVLEE